MIDWRHWHNEPFLIGGLVFLGWLWAILAGPMRTRLAAAAGVSDAGFPIAHAVRFYAGLLVFYLAVGSPLDQVAEGYLLSAHMLQHQLLIYPAAILFLLGIPHWMIDPVFGSGALMKLARFATRPFVCALVFLLTFGAWHAPLLYSAALENKVVHVLEHLLFFGAALLYWWPILSPSRVLPPARHGTQMLYLLAVIIGMMPIHAYITFSGDVLYPAYEFAPRLFDGFSAQDDQLLAGVSMQLVAMLVGLGTLGWAFFRWYEAGERRTASALVSPTRQGV